MAVAAASKPFSWAANSRSHIQLSRGMCDMLQHTATTMTRLSRTTGGAKPAAAVPGRSGVVLLQARADHKAVARVCMA
jgi:hypothetical protein